MLANRGRQEIITDARDPALPPNPAITARCVALLCFFHLKKATKQIVTRCVWFTNTISRE